MSGHNAVVAVTCSPSDEEIRDSARLEGKSMKKGRPIRTTVGLWIDHRKAIVVAMSARGETTKLIISKVERQLGRPGGIRSTIPYEPLQVPSDDRRQRKLTGQLNIYYDAVAASVRGADYILLFGPGEAAGELKKRLKRAKLRGSVLGVEVAARMTAPQIIAKVRRFFRDNCRQQQHRDARADLPRSHRSRTSA